MILAGNIRSQNMAAKVFVLFLFFYFSLSSAFKTIFNYSVVDANGKMVDLKKYQGKVLLITNVASYCGFTEDHYQEYVKLQQEMGDMFHILAFPCNQFGQQEPEAVDAIISNMKEKYRINFEIFDKIDVTGDNVPAAWRHLIAESKTSPEWNFYKYLVNGDGEVWGAWGPKVSVKHIRPFITDAVKQAKEKAAEPRIEL